MVAPFAKITMYESVLLTGKIDQLFTVIAVG